MKTIMWIMLGVVALIILTTSILLVTLLIINQHKIYEDNKLQDKLDKCDCNTYWSTLYVMDMEQIEEFVKEELARDRICTTYCIEEYE